MIKKISALILFSLMILSFASCKDDEVKHKTGWQNPEEPTSSEEISTDSIEDEETTKTSLEASATQSTDITFSSDKALTVGSFESEIYGKLFVYFQDGYFLLFDEFKDKSFIVNAQGYSAAKTDGKAQTIFTDMNFDGYTDFGVCYYKDALNSYYFCFLWDNSIRNFTYYLPLSSLANPEFNTDKKNITSVEKLTTSKATEKIYSYNSQGLIMLSSKDITEEPSTDAAETVNPELSYTLEGSSAQINLRTKANSHSKWVCSIDDENIALISSQAENEALLVQTFTLSAISPGATTVIFRYKSVSSGEYIEEVIINAVVSPDLTINIVVPE